MAQTGHWLPALRPEALDYSLPPTGVNDSEYNQAVAAAVETDLPANTTDVLQREGDPAPSLYEEQPSHIDSPPINDPVTNVAREPSPPSTLPAKATEHFDQGRFSDDETDLLDPAWGIRRVDTTQLLQNVNRSNSFPAVAGPSPPSVHNLNTEPDVETLEASAEFPGSTDQHDVATSDPQQVPYHDDETHLLPSSSSWNNMASMSQVNEVVTEETQRFEEGIPLMHHSQSPEDPPNQENSPHLPGDDPFALVPDDPEASFFSNQNDNHDPHPPRPPPLDRKSTEQVMSSLALSHQPDLDMPPRTKEEDSSFFDKLGDSSQVNTADADPLPEPDASLWAAALDDDEEFLVEDADDLLPDSEPGSPSSFVASLQDSAPAAQSNDVSNVNPPSFNPPRRQSSANPYAPHQPSVTDMLQLSPSSNTTHGQLGLSRPGLGQNNSFQAHVQNQRPPVPQPTKSFVDQAKDGYKSPYDLPLELSKPRRRAHAPQPVQTSKTVAPPPRSSSLSGPLQSPFSPAISSTAPPGAPPATLNSTSGEGRSVSSFSPPVKPPDRKASASSSFFEELPPISKPRPSSNSGRYTPQQPLAQGLPQLPPQSPPQAEPQPPLLSAQASDPYAQFQLRAPDRLDPYANLPLQPPAPGPAAQSSRYSPAPPVAASAAQRPGVGPRYSPVPPSQPTTAQPNRYVSQHTPPVLQPQAPPSSTIKQGPQASAVPAPLPNILPFQPRTSSPLAYHKPSVGEAAPLAASAPTIPRSGPLARQVSHTGSYTPQPAVSTPGSAVFPTSNPLSSPPRAVNQGNLPPPRRSQTQSPSKQRPQPAFQQLARNEFPTRPASAYGQSAPVGPSAQSGLNTLHRPQYRTASSVAEMDFVRPVDDSQFDPLERWKGAPLYRFGFGGAVATSFPKHVPRYTTGAARPQIKSSPGEVRVGNLKEILPQNEAVNSFPGPLRSKTKKKDVLAWMSSYIAGLESAMSQQDSLHLSLDLARMRDEKILLWKIVRALVEHDGTLDGPALNTVNLILSPETHAVDAAPATQYRDQDNLSGIYRPSGSTARPESTDPMAVELLRKRLLNGDRQGAVIHAMDNRLWSHALIISSTMDRSMWGQVVREFVRQEVKASGSNAEALSALYEIFGGNLEDSIDELVPPSARAGLQMMSKTDNTGPTKNALEGLHRWRETLSLILNNRSPGDHQALAVLGKLLQDYQRTYAAHICYIFSRNPSTPPIFGGVDNEQAPIVLLGADHKAQPVTHFQDQDAILLTEIYEFATSVLASGSSTASLPHLAVYKLHRAMHLSEIGLASEAQSYCDALLALYKSSNKLSPYYHPLFTASLEELSARLKQTPVQSSSSWIGKPSLEKVSGSVWNKFTTFVAGDDSDAESKGSGKDVTEAGPFANVSGTPSVSRSGSQHDIYSSVYGVSSPPPLSNTIAASRYAPNGVHSARSSPEMTRARPSIESQRSPPATSQDHRQFETMNMLQTPHMIQPPNPYQPISSVSPSASYSLSPPRSSYVPNGYPHTSAGLSQPGQIDPPIPTTPAEAVTQEPQFGSAEFPAMNQPSQFLHAEATSFGQHHPQEDATSLPPPPPEENASYGYADPTQSYGYEPPSSNGYVPYVPEPDSPEEAPKPKKKPFLDNDDDDGYLRNSAPASPPAHRLSSETDTDLAARKRQNDAAADAAFRAAAEADAAREKEKAQAKRSSSWFGGWLGGKKPADGLDAGPSKGSEPKVYKAKLGESKMKLYYDKELGKWVNPDNPDAATKSATPPPPRMGGTPGPPSGPPRALGTGHGSSSSLPNVNSGMPLGAGSRAGTPLGGLGSSPAPQIAAPTGPSGPASTTSTPPLGVGPTSHPGLGPPSTGSRPGTALSNSSSIDELIGPAMGRKGPSKGGKKAKGRYVDVMAK
ncbi:hypothetical protein B0A52_08215 [Exophiala mesophila]|uniref:Protein transport protein sec16 n=1 Tax=Exophiala mesophila TaxID=212818 RepID=A0A438MWE4_EXOME|nr:hypothetical protein B0A52_08215 [Exophiala mesophila]